MKSFWKLERTNDSQILAVKQNNRNQQDQILAFSLVEENELRHEPGLMKLNQVFNNYISRSEKCPFVPEKSMDTSNFPRRFESMQGCECGLKQSTKLGGRNMRLWLRVTLEVGQGVVFAIEKTPPLKLSSGRKRCLKFSKRRSVSFGGMYTKRYFRKFYKLNKASRKQVELDNGTEFSSTVKLMVDTKVKEAQPDLTTGVLCVITTEELDFRSTLDSEARTSVEQSKVFNRITSDRVENRYTDPQLNTGVEGTE